MFVGVVYFDWGLIRTCADKGVLVLDGRNVKLFTLRRQVVCE